MILKYWRKKFKDFIKHKVLKTVKNIVFNLTAGEAYTLTMLILYMFLNIIYFYSFEKSVETMITNILLVLTISTVVHFTSKKEKKGLFRKLYYVPIILIIYSQVQHYIRIINPVFYDDILIAWDYLIFGVNPTEELHKISNPVLTEFLQFSYMTYFLMPILHGVELHMKKKENEFDSFQSVLLFSYYFSYILYFIMPAVGPRFFVHEFASLSNELPGLFLTEAAREMVNSGGAYDLSIKDPVMAFNRDCMPSGHTWITLVNLLLAFKFKSKVRWIAFIFGASLIFSTVYLRYHYVVDVIAGICLAALSVWLEPKISRWLKKKLKKQDS